MQKFTGRYGDWGMVAGAAEGLGAAFTEILAKWGMNVILVDRDNQKMEETATRMAEHYGISTVRISADLSQLNNLDDILSEMQKVECRLLIYNAAYGPVKGFMENTSDELDYYLDLNARMPIQLIHRFLKNLKADLPAGILIMSSLAGLWGTRWVVPYGATKAFDYNLAEGLHYELKERNVEVMACCAGATDTPGYRRTRPSGNFMGPVVMKPEKVAEEALKKLGKKAVYIPGFMNQLNYFVLTRILPRTLSASLMNRVMRDMYK